MVACHYRSMSLFHVVFCILLYVANKLSLSISSMSLLGLRTCSAKRCYLAINYSGINAFQLVAMLLNHFPFIFTSSITYVTHLLLCQINRPPFGNSCSQNCTIWMVVCLSLKIGTLLFGLYVSSCNPHSIGFLLTCIFLVDEVRPRAVTISSWGGNREPSYNLQAK